MRQLIVNADDFGLTPGVNRAIVELHQKGVLTSATLMANAPATGDGIALAQKSPSLGVGCHIVLVDGEPILSPHRDIPNLADPHTGRLRPSLFAFLAAAYRVWPPKGHSRLTHEIETEAAAQIARLQQAGLKLTHVDTHKHLHLFPAVLRPVLRAARAAGIRVVRNPFEPVWSRRASSKAPSIRRLEVNLLARLKPVFERIVAEEGFTTTDGTLGVLSTGTLDAAGLNSLLREMPTGTWELVTHPGYNDLDLASVRTRLLESRDVERQALSVIRDHQAVELISFAGLVSSEPEGHHSRKDLQAVSSSTEKSVF